MTARLPAFGVLLVAGVAGVYGAYRAGGAAAGLLAAAALACAGALLMRTEPASVEGASVSRLFDGALLALPGILTVYLSFESGAYFPETPALAAIMLAVVLVLRITLVDEPFAGFSWPLAAAVAGLGLYSLWILTSALWSDAPARSLIEFDRALGYLLLLVLFGSVPRTAQRLRWMAAGLALGVVAVAAAALATRLFPDVFPTAPNLGDEQLSYPLTYSNALGLLCVLGGVLCLYFATSARAGRTARAGAAAALPILATAIYLTLSRGPVAAAAVGLVVFAVLGRPRGLLPGVIATVPLSIVAVVSAYRHELLTTADPPAAAAAAQGHEVALVVVLCALGAAALRLLLTPLDDRLERFSLAPARRRPVIATGWAVIVVGVTALALATGIPGRIADQYDRFVETAEAGPNEDIRASVFDPSNRGLLDNWSVALRAFRDEPVHGQGAGTYELYWNRERPANQVSYNLNDAHSLYLEALGELGAVGFLLLVVFLGAILASLAPLRRGRTRSLYAALFATALAWAVHAGVEWDWEMPAVTAWLFAFGGAGLATHARSASRASPRQGVRVAVALLVLVAAIAPGLVVASQRQLDDGIDALRAGNCGKAIDRSAAAIASLEIRPEPYEVIAYCQARRGNHRLATQAMDRAVDRDPDNWRYRYGRAVLRGGAGLDPRPDLLTARALNPHQPEVNELLATIEKGTAVAWEPTLTPVVGSVP